MNARSIAPLYMSGLNLFCLFLDLRLFSLGRTGQSPHAQSANAPIPIILINFIVCILV